MQTVWKSINISNMYNLRKMYNLVHLLKIFQENDRVGFNWRTNLCIVIDNLKFKIEKHWEPTFLIYDLLYRISGGFISSYIWKCQMASGRGRTVKTIIWYDITFTHALCVCSERYKTYICIWKMKTISLFSWF